MTEDYCTFEEVEREKGPKREVELHLPFMLSRDIIKAVDESRFSAQRKSRADTNDVSGKKPLNVRQALFPSCQMRWIFLTQTK